MIDWRDISSAPRDGTIVAVMQEDVGVFPMAWNARGSNSLFQPDPTGIWELPDSSMTWTEDGGAGPSHWCPLSEWQKGHASHVA